MLEVHKEVKGHRQSALCLAARPGFDGVIASGSDDQTVRIWDCNTGKCLKAIRGFHAPVVSVLFSSDGWQLYAAAGNQVVLFDLRTEDMILSTPTYTFTPLKEELNQISLSGDGKLLAACDDSGEVHIFDTAKRTLVKVLKGRHKNICSCVIFRPEHATECISGGLDCTLAFWDIAAGKAKSVVNTGELLSAGAGPLLNPPMVNSVSASADGRYMAAGLGDGTVAVFTEEGKIRWRAGSQTADIGSVAHVDRRSYSEYFKLDVSRETARCALPFSNILTALLSIGFLPASNESCLVSRMAGLSFQDARSNPPPQLSGRHVLVSGGNDRMICIWQLDQQREDGTQSDLTVQSPHLLMRANHGEKINWLCTGRLSSSANFVAVADTSLSITIYRIGAEIA